MAELTDIRRLTQAQCEDAEPEVRDGLPRPTTLDDGGGLFLVITPGRIHPDRTYNFTKSWVLRYSFDGQRRRKGLGSFPDVDLEDARGLAAAHRGARKQGADPLAVRRKERAQKAQKRAEQAKARTFNECLEAWVVDQDRHKGRNAKYAKQVPAELRRYASPVIGKTLTQDVTTAMVLEVLAPIWHTKPVVARRVRSGVERILQWAHWDDPGYRNPAERKRFRDRLPNKRKVEHQAAVDYREIPVLMAKVRAETGAMWRALEFALLTASRCSEVRCMTWGEVDLESPDGPVWKVPAGRIKAGALHTVPLSDRAVEILKARPGGPGGTTEPVFPGLRKTGKKATRFIGNNTMTLALQRLHGGRYADFTLHGSIRATFRTWAEEETDFDPGVIKKGLAHAIDDKVDAAYQRGALLAKRRRLMTAWADYCGGAPKLEVVRAA